MFNIMNGPKKYKPAPGSPADNPACLENIDDIYERASDFNQKMFEQCGVFPKTESLKNFDTTIEEICENQCRNEMPCQYPYIEFAAAVLLEDNVSQRCQGNIARYAGRIHAEAESMHPCTAVEFVKDAIEVGEEACIECGGYEESCSLDEISFE